MTMGQAAKQRLQDMGYTLDYKTYPMEHAVCPQGITDISSWLHPVLD
jgi:phospholipase/carboxylesterase